MIVGEARGEKSGVALEQLRLLECDNPLHAVGIDRLIIGKVAHDLQRGPLAGNRPGDELGVSHAGNGAAELARARQVLIDQGGGIHRAVLMHETLMLLSYMLACLVDGVLE